MSEARDELHAVNKTQQELRSLLHDELIPQFCADGKFAPESFRWDSVRVSDVDACDFIRAFREGLMTHVERGLYRALKSSAGEQFFWSGSKHAAPRPFTLWLEPIITVAALGRLHWNHDWPIDLIGTQSSDWAFDLVAYRRGSMNEYIAGEVKKSEIELERLIDLMKRLGRSPDAPVPKAGRERNAYKKVEALRSRKSPIFWAVGPAGYNHVFSVAYGADSIVELIPAEVEELKFKTNTA